jgi:lysophospholipase L1-like esterase
VNRCRPTRADAGIINSLAAVALGVVVLLAAALGAVAIASLAGDDGADDAPVPAVYVSIGDSVAAGSGASEADQTSFAALLAATREVALFNVAVAGATTQDVIEKQMPDVLPLLGNDRVRFITISAGGNDLAGLIPNVACTEDPVTPSCPLEEALAGVEQQLATILTYIREADARVPVVLLAYPNFFSGTGHAFDAPAARVLPHLGELMREIAARYERVAVAEPSFDGRGGELTHVLDERFDPHPNDAGHRVIADAMESALDAIGD